jgi:hypothetical protein
MPPVVPGGQGHGMNTRAAYGGASNPTVYIVDKLTDTGVSGELRWALEATVPRIVVFAISGYVDLADMIRITSPYMTVAGQTAPSPGITLRKYGIEVQTHDLLLQHFRIRPGEWGTGFTGNCGIIAYGVECHDLVLDHMSVSWGPDENIAADTYYSGDMNMTVWRTITGEGLNYPASVPLSAGHAMLVQSPCKKVYIGQSLMAATNERNPYWQGGCGVAATNNVISNAFAVWHFLGTNFDINGNPRTNLPWQVSIAGNRVVPGPNTGTASDYLNTFAMFDWNAGGGISPGNQAYRTDNTYRNTLGLNVVEVENGIGYNPDVASPPTNAPLTGIFWMPSTRVETFVKANAGARPLDRDSVDTAIVNDVTNCTQRTNTGNYITHQNEVGGYPTLAVNRRTFTVPANPHTVTAQGYTNLELYLHSFAAALEPRTTWSVAQGDNLQTIINVASLGDTIVIDAGASFQGNYTLPNKYGVMTLTLTTNATLPAADARITPATAAGLPIIRAAAGGLPALATTPGCHDYAIVGLRFPANPGGFNDIIGLGDGSAAQNSASLVPYNLTLDRLYIYGDPLTGQKRGISLHSASTTIKNCYIADIKVASQDSQAIASWNGPGPYLIDNNYIEGAGENVLFGGDTIRILNQLPSDLTFTNNDVAKPYSWRGGPWQIKNLFEVKCGQRFYIHNNRFEYDWAEAQDGDPVLFTVRNEYGAHNWATVRDITFSGNYLRHAGGGISILGRDDRPGYVSVLATNFLIEDNEITDVNWSYGGGGVILELNNGGDNITFNHNTCINAGGGNTVYLLGSTHFNNLVITNNVLLDNGLGYLQRPGLRRRHGIARGVRARLHVQPQRHRYAERWLVSEPGELLPGDDR